jgi:hypothetical protein
MEVMYEGKLWTLESVRGSLFQDLQSSCPEMKIWIYRPDEKAYVPIKKLVDYSKWRNTQ